MAFGDTVQSALATGASGEASATLSAGATAGNLLAFTIARSATTGGGDWGSITDWTSGPRASAASGLVTGAMFWMIAAGGETTVTTAMTSETGNWAASLVEYEGPFSASPLDQSTDDETNVNSVVTSQSSGTTGSTAQNDELAIANFCIDSAPNATDGRSYNNSFTEVTFANSGARAGNIQAKKVLTATGTVECTFTTTDIGDRMYGAIATWKKSAGGTTTRRYSFPLTGVG